MHSSGQVTPEKFDDSELFPLAKDAEHSKLTTGQVSELPSTVDMTLDGTQNDLQVSAADYDPSKDHREDQERCAKHNAAAALADGIEEIANKPDTSDTPDTSVGLDEDQEEGSNEEDDDFDMFSMDTGPKKKRRAHVCLLSKTLLVILKLSDIEICDHSNDHAAPGSSQC